MINNISSIINRIKVNYSYYIVLFYSDIYVELNIFVS